MCCTKGRCRRGCRRTSCAAAAPSSWRSTGVTSPTSSAALTSRDQAVVDAASGEEIVLWFEHDLYDQLHVLQVLDLLHGLQTSGRLAARVTAILADDYLAAQPDDLLSQWFASRMVVSEAAACRRRCGLGRVPRARAPGAAGVPASRRLADADAGAPASPSAVPRGRHRPLAHGTSDAGSGSRRPATPTRAVSRLEPRVRGRDLHGRCSAGGRTSARC